MHNDNSTQLSPKNNTALQEAMDGNYEFKMGKIFSEAWDKTNGAKASFWGAFLYFLLVIIVIMVPIAFSISSLGLSPDIVTGPTEGNFNSFSLSSLLTSYFIKLVFILITTPLTAGILMIGVLRSVNAPLKANMVFNYYKYWQKLWAVPVLILVIGILNDFFVAGMDYINEDNSTTINLLSGLGSLFFAFLKLYLTVSYLLFPALIIDKDLGIFKAMEASRKAISHHFFKTLGFIIVLTLVIFISVIPLAIPLIWTLPMVNNAVGILYRDMFGVSKKS